MRKWRGRRSRARWPEGLVFARWLGALGERGVVENGGRRGVGGGRAATREVCRPVDARSRQCVSGGAQRPRWRSQRVVARGRCRGHAVAESRVGSGARCSLSANGWRCGRRREVGRARGREHGRSREGICAGEVDGGSGSPARGGWVCRWAGGAWGAVRSLGGGGSQLDKLEDGVPRKQLTPSVADVGCGRRPQGPVAVVEALSGSASRDTPPIRHVARAPRAHLVAALSASREAGARAAGNTGPGALLRRMRVRRVVAANASHVGAR